MEDAGVFLKTILGLCLVGSFVGTYHGTILDVSNAFPFGQEILGN